MKILTGLIKDVFLTRHVEKVPENTSSIKKVLNVGGGSKATAIADYFLDGNTICSISIRGDVQTLSAMRAN